MDVISAEQQTEATVSQQNGSKLVVVCDSIPKLVKPNDVSSSLPCEVQHVRPTINEATDFVQDSAKLSDILLVHSGTNNIHKESYVTVNNRFDRLETNIKHRKLKCVALSSVVYRNNWTPRLRWSTIIFGQSVPEITGYMLTMTTLMSPASHLTIYI